MKIKIFFCLVLLSAITVLSGGTASEAATITNIHSGDCFQSANPISIEVAPGCYTSREDFCYIRVYDENSNLVFNYDVAYTDSVNTITASFLPEKAGKYTISTCSYYYYTVGNSENISLSSSKDNATINVTGSKQVEASKPKLKASPNGSGTVTLSISGLMNGYEVYRADSKKGKYKKIGTAELSGYIDSALEQKTYYYKVRGTVKFGKKTYYTKYSSPVKADASISGLKTEISVSLSNDNNVVISVISEQKAEGYKYYRANAKTGKYYLIKTTTDSSFTDEKAGNKLYNYKAVPYVTLKGKKKTGSASNIVSFTKNDPAKPGRPKLSIRQATYEDGTTAKGRIIISFNRTKNTDFYKLYVSTDGGKTYKYENLGWNIKKDSEIEGSRLDGWWFNAKSGEKIYYRLSSGSQSFQNGEYENFSEPVSFTAE